MKLSAEQRRALELLAANPCGCPDGIMAAKGFETELMVELPRTGLATATAERVRFGQRMIPVVRLRISDAGLLALAEPT
jgi:hypothetical protein